MTIKTRAAWIGAVGASVAAIITGLFIVFSQNGNNESNLKAVEVEGNNTGIIVNGNNSGEINNEK